MEISERCWCSSRVCRAAQYLVGATEGSGLPSWGANKVRRQLSTSCRAAAARCAEVGEVCDLGVDLLAILGGERHRPEELAVRLAKLASQLVGTFVGRLVGKMVGKLRWLVSMGRVPWPRRGGTP